MEKKKAAKRIVSAKKSVADELNAKLKDALSNIKHKDEVIQVNCDIVFPFPFSGSERGFSLICNAFFIISCKFSTSLTEVNFFILIFDFKDFLKQFSKHR